MNYKTRALGMVVFILGAFDLAHADSPPAGTLLGNLGEAVLHIKSDIVILPNTTRVVFKSGKIVSGPPEPRFPVCSIELRGSDRKARILKGGVRNIQLTGDVSNDVCHGGGCSIHLMASPDDQTVQSILCVNTMDAGQAITLKVLLDAFGGYLTVETPPPGHGISLDMPAGVQEAVD